MYDTANENEQDACSSGRTDAHVSSKLETLTGDLIMENESYNTTQKNCQITPITPEDTGLPHQKAVDSVPIDNGEIKIGETPSGPYHFAEPGIFLLYKTPKKENPKVREVSKTQIKEQIDALPLPFGMVGVHYESILDFSSKELTDNFGEIEFLAGISIKLKELGLSYRILKKNVILLEGTPTEEFSGDFYFFIIDFYSDYKEELRKNNSASVHRKSFEEYSKDHVYSKPFQISADPRSLWDPKPVKDYEGYENENQKNEGREIPAQSVELIAASQRGRSHAHAAKPRDDCFFYDIDEQTGWNFVAVADGAGSARYSRKGSEIACQTVVEQLHGMINADYNEFLHSKAKETFVAAQEEFMENQGKWNENRLQSFAQETKLEQIFHIAVDKTIRAIHEEAKRKEGASVKDYHTTLLCAAFKHFGPRKPDPKEPCGWFFASYWVGDGGAAILRWNSTDRVLVLGKPDGGEFAGQTRFITMKDEINAEAIHKRLRFTFCDSFDALILATDGITDPFFPPEAASDDEKFWLEFYEQKLKKGSSEEPNGCPDLFDDTKSAQEKSEALLKWLNFWSVGNHDDRTILIVKPKSRT